MPLELRSYNKLKVLSLISDTTQYNTTPQDPNASYDVNSYDYDPMPRYDILDSNRHGTRCAGEVAAQANNSLCSVGVAYEASVGGEATEIGCDVDF